MRICLLNNLFPPVQSGSSLFTYRLAERLNARGHDVTVITAQFDKSVPSSENQQGIHIYRLPCLLLPQMSIAHNFKWMSFTFTPSNVKRIFGILTDRQVELLHLNGHIFDLALSSVLARPVYLEHASLQNMVRKWCCSIVISSQEAWLNMVYTRQSTP